VGSEGLLREESVGGRERESSSSWIADDIFRWTRPARWTVGKRAVYVGSPVVAELVLEHFKRNRVARGDEGVAHQAQGRIRVRRFCWRVEVLGAG
jgi:hypothetical protein